MCVRFCLDGGTQIWHQVWMFNVFHGLSKGIYIWDVGQHVFCGIQQLWMLNWYSFNLSWIILNFKSLVWNFLINSKIWFIFRVKSIFGSVVTYFKICFTRIFDRDVFFISCHIHIQFCHHLNFTIEGVHLFPHSEPIYTPSFYLSLKSQSNSVHTRCHEGPAIRMKKNPFTLW